MSVMVSRRMNLFSFFLIFSISFLFRLYDIKAVGETWDEVAVVRNGIIYLKGLSTGDFGREFWQLNHEHPPLAKYLYGTTQIFAKFSPRLSALDPEYLEGKRFTLARVLSAVLGSLAVVFVYLLANFLYDREVALFAAGIFSFLPHVLAHTKIAALESPLLFFTLVSTYFYLKRRFFLSGLFFGFALATKFNALFFVPLFFLLGIFSESGKEKFNLRGFVIVNSMAVFFLFAIWPWLWSAPLANLADSLKLSNDLADSEYFLGRLSYQPTSYYFFYFFATTPPLILGLFLIFLFKLFREKKRKDFIIFFYFLTPFVVSLFSLKQDGVRYIFPFYPALAISSSVGLFFILKYLKRIFKLKVASSLLVFAGVIIFFQLIYDDFSIHPYYLDYYNSLVGGPKRVYEKKLFEIGWWGEGIREAVFFVNRSAEKNSSVNTSFSPAHVAPEFREDLIVVHGKIGEDYVITNTYSEWYDRNYIDPKEYRLLYAVKAAGAPIAKVYKAGK